jgi:hypothetical protein
VALAGAGGVAGGEKFLCGNVFLKFARDAYGVYGGDEGAAKSASHELRSLRSLLGCDVPGLRFPLMVRDSPCVGFPPSTPAVACVCACVCESVCASVTAGVVVC